jgi:peptide/nickel transport system substrate-binding protein
VTTKSAAWVLALVLSAPACRPRDAQGTVEVRVALTTAPLSFDPHSTDEVVAFSINSNIYESLVTTDDNLNPGAGIAVTWVNPDALTWVFDLSPGRRFHDGSPLTSEDVAQSLLRARNDPASEWGGGLLSIERIETPTPTRVVVRTRAPDATLIQALAATLIVPRSAGLVASSTLKVRPVGSGPYRLESWDPRAGRAVLAAWDGYAGPRPSVRRLVFTSTPDDRQRLSDLVAGNVDLISDVPPELGATVAAAPRLRLIESPSLTEIFMAFDVSRPRSPYASPGRNPFLDRRVRRAFAAAIDRTALVHDVLLEEGEVAEQIAAPRVFGFDPGLKGQAYDPTEGRRLMAASGFGEGFSVVLDAPDASFAGDVRVAPFVARSLSAIGVRVEVRAQDKETLFRRQAGRDTSLIIGGWNCGSADLQEILEFLLHTTDATRGYGRENVGGYSNGRLDSLAEEAHRTLSRDRRLALLRAASAVAVDEMPWVPLYIPHDRYAARKALAWTPRPDRVIQGARMAWAEGAR